MTRKDALAKRAETKAKQFGITVSDRFYYKSGFTAAVALLFPVVEAAHAVIARYEGEALKNPEASILALGCSVGTYRILREKLADMDAKLADVRGAE